MIARWMAEHLTRGQIVWIRRGAQCVFWALALLWLIIFLVAR